MFERRFDDQQLGDACTGGSMEHHLLLCHHLNLPWMDDQISQLGQHISSSTTGQANIHEHSKRFHEQTQQGQMPEGGAITPRITVCVKNLAFAPVESAVETGIPRMSIRQTSVPLACMLMPEQQRQTKKA